MACSTRASGTAERGIRPSTGTAHPSMPKTWNRLGASALGLLWRDKFAFVAALFLVLVAFCAICSDHGSLGNAAHRNEPAGAQCRRRSDSSAAGSTCSARDTLGRSILARHHARRAEHGHDRGRGGPLLAASSARCSASSPAIAKRLVSDLIMRLTDILMSFPSLLLALVVLYVLEPGLQNLIFVLALPACRSICARRAPRCWRSASRMFVVAALVTGAATAAHHLQAHPADRRADPYHHRDPGLRVRDARRGQPQLPRARRSGAGDHLGGDGGRGPDYLGTAWWLSFWPGLAITLTTMSLNLFSNWLRIADRSGPALAAGSR